MHTIIQNALDAVVEMDAGGCITFWNPQAEKIFGWKSGEVIGQLMSATIIPPHYREAHERGLKRFFETGVGPVLNKRLELTALNRDGHEFPIELTVIPLKNGKKYTFSAFLRDISDRKKSEEQMKKANAELQRLNDLKTEFTSMVSHELRTPLNSIKEAIALVLEGIDGPINDEQGQTLGIAKSNVDRLARMINNVLDYTRHEYGKLKMSFALSDLNSLVTEVYDFMKPVVTKKMIRFTQTLPAKPLFAICDSDRMKEVLINLIDNAIKYTADGGEICLALKAEGEMVDLKVSDTGSGIKKEEREKIFLLFDQGSAGLGKAGGSGVGLAVCELIARQHGGEIKVQSEPGKGTEFTVRWPIQRSLSPENRE